MTISDRKKIVSSIVQKYETFQREAPHYLNLAMVFDQDGKHKVIQLTSPYHCILFDVDNLNEKKELMVQDLNYSLAKQTASFLDIHNGDIPSYIDKTKDSLMFKIRKEYVRFSHKTQ